MAKKHVNEFSKTTFANLGRVAGTGIVEDRYDEEYLNHNYRPQPKFEHSEKYQHGEVIVMKAVELFRQGKDASVFFMRANGKLDRADAFSFGFRDLVSEERFFEQIKEAHDENNN